MTIKNTAEYLKNIICTSNRYKDRYKYIGAFFLIAATLDKRRRIISIGENSLTKTHPLMYHYSSKSKMNHKIYLHAELSAMVKSHSPAHSIMVIRVSRGGEYAMAMPCPLCMMAINEANIKKVYYSNRDKGLTMVSMKEFYND
jgi:deoxycytidylate deaminase